MPTNALLTRGPFSHWHSSDFCFLLALTLGFSQLQCVSLSDTLALMWGWTHATQGKTIELSICVHVHIEPMELYDGCYSTHVWRYGQTDDTVLYVSMDTVNSKVHACAVTHQLHKFNCSINNWTWLNWTKVLWASPFSPMASRTLAEPLTWFDYFC